MPTFSKRGLIANLLTSVNKAVSSAVSDVSTDVASVLPDFLTNNPLPDGYPWGLKNAKDTNYYTDYPQTGVVRSYDWTITKQTIAPDGVEVTGLVVNGQYPGPTIEANWGDTIQVTVHNNLDEGTSLHWHGMLQKNSQDMDGVPGGTQCPIPPGQSYTYSFVAELYGTGWWHSHYSEQYASGLAGAMVIFGPKNANYDIDLGPVLISDWYHTYYKDLLKVFTMPLPDAKYPYSNNVLINGKNNYPCSATNLPCTENAGEASFNFTSGKVHRLRLINPSADATLKFSIDEHVMNLIAQDYVEIYPTRVHVVTLGPGQRSDVLVQGKNGDDGAYYMRVHPASGCANVLSDSNYVQATIYYPKADRSKAPSSTAQDGWNSDYCGNDDLATTRPYLPLNPGEPSVTQTINLDVHSNGTHGLWYMNNVSQYIDFNTPILLESKSGDNNFTTAQNVYNYGSNSSVRWIVNNPTGIAHPMHYHGHNIYVLAEGTGTWDGEIVNSNNPARRDTQIVQAGGYIVLQFDQDNPGVWIFHCHIAWHLALGFGLFVLEQPDKIQSSVAVDQGLCSSWADYTRSHKVDQIADGA